MRNYKIKISKQYDFFGIIKEHELHEKLKVNGYRLGTVGGLYEKGLNYRTYGTIGIEIWLGLEILRLNLNGRRITPNELEERSGKDYRLLMKLLTPEIKILKELEVI